MQVAHAYRLPASVLGAWPAADVLIAGAAVVRAAEDRSAHAALAELRMARYNNLAWCAPEKLEAVERDVRRGLPARFRPRGSSVPAALLGDVSTFRAIDLPPAAPSDGGAA